jgi:hypothetical protein
MEATAYHVNIFKQQMDAQKCTSLTRFFIKLEPKKKKALR